MFNNQQNLNAKHSIFLDFIKECNPAMWHHCTSTYAQKYSKTDRIKNLLGLFHSQLSMFVQILGVFKEI